MFTFHSPRAHKEVFNNSITKFLTRLYNAVSRIAVQTELTTVCVSWLWTIVSDTENSGAK